MGSAGVCFGTREGVDIAGASSAISQLHCRHRSEKPISFQ
jgi:hypothetical protein